MKHDDMSLESLLVAEAYDAIIDRALKDPNHTASIYLAIAYYKTEQYEKAESMIETLLTEDASIERQAYLILCKIKTNQLVEALRLYQQLCMEQTNRLVDYIHQGSLSDAKNICLFLQSIPLDIPKGIPASNDLIYLAKNGHYKTLISNLDEHLNGSLS